MILVDDLHAQLNVLDAHILATRKSLKVASNWDEGQSFTNDGSQPRYRFPKPKVDFDVAKLTARGKHVTARKQSVMAWIKGLQT